MVINGGSQWGLDLHGGSRLPTPMLWGQVATFCIKPSIHPPLGPLEGRLDVVTIETVGIWHSGASELSAQSCGVLAHKKCKMRWMAVFSPRIKRVAEEKVWNHNFYMEMCERKLQSQIRFHVKFLDSMLIVSGGPIEKVAANKQFTITLNRFDCFFQPFVILSRHSFGFQSPFESQGFGLLFPFCRIQLKFSLFWHLETRGFWFTPWEKYQRYRYKSPARALRKKGLAVKEDVIPIETWGDLPAIAMLVFGSTWRIIPVRKWLVTPVYKPIRPFGRGITLLRGLTNHGY